MKNQKEGGGGGRSGVTCGITENLSKIEIYDTSLGMTDRKAGRCWGKKRHSNSLVQKGYFKDDKGERKKEGSNQSL